MVWIQTDRGLILSQDLPHELHTALLSTGLVESAYVVLSVCEM